jgi:hypothetical protein
MRKIIVIAIVVFGAIVAHADTPKDATNVIQPIGEGTMVRVGSRHHHKRVPSIDPELIFGLYSHCKLPHTWRYHPHYF